MSIELKNVSYLYSPGTAYEMRALENINLTIPEHQFIGMIGHTGSGKSTLIQLFNGLLRPTGGEVCYNGENIWGEELFYDQDRENTAQSRYPQSDRRGHVEGQ